MTDIVVEPAAAAAATNNNNNEDDNVIDATTWPLSWFAALEPTDTNDNNVCLEEAEEPTNNVTTNPNPNIAASLLLQQHNTITDDNNQQQQQQLLQRLDANMRDMARTNQFLIAENIQLRRRQAERQAFAADIASLAADHHTQMLDAVLVQQHQLGRLQGDILRALRAFGISFEIGGAINAGPPPPAYTTKQATNNDEPSPPSQ